MHCTLCVGDKSFSSPHMYRYTCWQIQLQHIYTQRKHRFIFYHSWTITNLTFFLETKPNECFLHLSKQTEVTVAGGGHCRRRLYFIFVTLFSVAGLECLAQHYSQEVKVITFPSSSDFLISGCEIFSSTLTPCHLFTKRSRLITKLEFKLD